MPSPGGIRPGSARLVQSTEVNSVIHRINRMKCKSSGIISIDAEKYLTKYVINGLNQTIDKRELLNLIKGIYGIPIS